MPTVKVVLPRDQDTIFEEGDTCKKEKKRYKIIKSQKIRIVLYVYFC